VSGAGQLLPYRKFDLHIHTPRSACYSVPGVTPSEIVRASLAAGLDAVAVTDHNSVAAVSEVQAAAEDSGLVVFPGVEITTHGGHFLAIFDPAAAVEEVEALLLELGLGPGCWGDGTAVAAVDTAGVLARVVARGGLALAAHVERWPSGFTQTNLPRTEKRAIHASPYLSGLEITIAEDRPRWEEGSMLGYPVPRACVQGSDAHSPAEIGRRPVYLRMRRVGLQGLKEALESYRDRVAFPRDMEGCKHEQGT